MAAVLVLIVTAGCDSVPVARLNPISLTSSAPAQSPSSSPTPSGSPTQSPDATSAPLAGPPPPTVPAPVLKCPALTLVAFSASQPAYRIIEASWSATGGCAPLTGNVNLRATSFAITFHIAGASGDVKIPVKGVTCTPVTWFPVAVSLSLQDRAGKRITAGRTVQNFLC